MANRFPAWRQQTEVVVRGGPRCAAEFCRNQVHVRFINIYMYELPRFPSQNIATDFNAQQFKRRVLGQVPAGIRMITIYCLEVCSPKTTKITFAVGNFLLKRNCSITYNKPNPSPHLTPPLPRTIQRLAS